MLKRLYLLMSKAFSSNSPNVNVVNRLSLETSISNHNLATGKQNAKKCNALICAKVLH